MRWIRDFLIFSFAILATSPALAATSVQSGPWNDPATWGGALPGLGEEVTISAGHVVHFPPGQDYTVELDRNLIVHGELEMRPQQVGNPYYRHTLRFVGVDETQFVMGGLFPCGTPPPATDVGVWVLCDGVLDLEGEPKLGWARTTADALTGAQSFTLDAAPTGWRPGDTIVIAPSEDISVPEARGVRGFEDLTIEQVGGNTVYFSPALGHDHPCAVGARGVYCPEVANISRNIVIEGQGAHSMDPQSPGRPHVFIQSTQPQSVQYTELRHLGPRTTADRQRNGRYAIHFHHMQGASVGSIVRGATAYHSGSYSFVPHESDGVTFEDTVAIDVFEAAYWWDEGDVSESAVFDHALAIAVDSKRRRNAGFTLSICGDQNCVIRDSAAVGVDGGLQSGSFTWDEDSGSTQPWIFERNLGHNTKANGIQIWQNCPFAESTGKCGGVNHIQDFVTFHNGWEDTWAGSGVSFGAYTNAYSFAGLDLFGNLISSMDLHARSRPTAEETEPGYLNAIRDFDAEGIIIIAKHRTAFDRPQLVIDGTLPGVRVRESSGEPGLYDFVRTGLEPVDFEIVAMRAGSVIRVQREDCTAFQLDGPDGAVSTIAEFYPCDPGEPPPEDTEAPTVPQNLVATAAGTSQIDLSWDASTDNVGVDHYSIYRDGGFLIDVTTTSHSDTGLTASTTYSYEVSAVDAAGNESAKSAPAQATTDDEPPPPPPSEWTLVGHLAEGVASGTASETKALPAGVAQGDAVIIVLTSDGNILDGTDGNGGVQTPGYEIVAQSSSSFTIPGYQVSMKFMGATPDTDVVIAQRDGAAQAVALQVWSGAAALEAPAVVATGDSTTMPDPPAYNVQTAGARVFAVMHLDDDDSADVTVAPAGYGDLLASDGGAPVLDATSAMASKEVAATGLEDPGEFTTSFDHWAAVTFALAPAQ